MNTNTPKSRNESLAREEAKHALHQADAIVSHIAGTQERAPIEDVMFSRYAERCGRAYSPGA